MNRNWRFVGGTSTPRTSLQAAVKAVLSGEVKDARAIYNSTTGELYDLLGNPQPPITAYQYQGMLNALGVFFVHAFHELPLTKEGFVPLMTQIGEPVFAGIKKAGTEYATALAKMQEAGEETTNASGPLEG